MGTACLTLVLATSVVSNYNDKEVMESTLQPTYIAEEIQNKEIMKDPIDKVVEIPIDDDNTTLEVGLSKSYLAANLSEVPEEVEVSKLSEGNIDYAEYDIEISSNEIESTKQELIKIAEEEERQRLEAERIAKEKAEAELKAKQAAEEAQRAKDAQRGTMKEIPNVSSNFKAYMDYRCITSRNSTQYKMQYDGNATTNSEGFRLYNGEYMVAVGSYYAKQCGTRLRITLDTGKQFYAVVGDQKADVHTDSKNQHRNGNIVEFIVDQKTIPSKCKQMGDMSYAPNANLQGKIAAIEVLG